MSSRRAVGKGPSGAGPLTAFVLHQYDWSESSLIVELFSRERGRIVVAAKGAKRPTSNFRSILLPFHRLQVQLGRAPADEKSDIHALRSAEISGWSGGLPRSGQALFAGFYANELLLKLLARDDPHALLFDRYADALPLLGAGDAATTQTALRAFELVLLRELGWLPDLHLTTQTLQALDPQRHYELHADVGLVASDDVGAAPLTGAQLLQIEAALTHGGFAPLCQAIASTAAAWRTPLRKLLHYHLSTPSLRTRDVLHGVQTLIPR